MASPKCFVSYSWESEDHKDWVRKLAEDLSHRGVTVILDQWDAYPGMDLPSYMETSIREADYVLLICTPTFARKADEGAGGVGYEKIIVTGEIYQKTSPPRKFVPIWKEGGVEAFPSYLKTKLFIDFRDPSKYASRLEDLLRHLYESPRYTRPPIGTAPSFRTEKSTNRQLRESQSGRHDEVRRSAVPPVLMIGGSIVVGCFVLFIVGSFLRSVISGSLTTPTKISLLTQIPSAEHSTIAVPTTVIAQSLAPTIPKSIPITPSPTPTTPSPPLNPAITPRPGEMVTIPAGEFLMGSTSKDIDLVLNICPDCLREWYNAEQPQHTVYLDTYWIDKFDVTNAQYKRCVDAGRCPRPIETKSNTRSSYFGNQEYDSYPVTYVTWDNAKAYCEWVGRRLPTEAEWEKAARGTDGRIYPWGNVFDASKANSVSNPIHDTTAIGTYSSGASPYGVLDMAGNVWNWVADWYNGVITDKYYSISPRDNPTGPSSGNSHVMRGGSWADRPERLRTAQRYEFYGRWDVLGIRCASSSTP